MVDAIADTSFIIDWVRYSKNKLLFKVFDVVYVLESVLAEIRSEGSLLWISKGLEGGKLAILPELPDISREALNLVAKSRRFPVRPVDYPEAFCMVVGKRLGLVVLTENGGQRRRREWHQSSRSLGRHEELLKKLRLPRNSTRRPAL